MKQLRNKIGSQIQDISDDILEKIYSAEFKSTDISNRALCCTNSTGRMII